VRFLVESNSPLLPDSGSTTPVMFIQCFFLTLAIGVYMTKPLDRDVNKLFSRNF
jgi:hypothetical protein